MAKIKKKKQITPSFDEDQQPWEPLDIAGGSINWYDHFRKLSVSEPEPVHILWPMDSMPRYKSNKKHHFMFTKTHVQKAHTNILLLIAQNWLIHKDLSVLEWIVKLGYFHTLESHTSMRINKVQLHTTIWMKLTYTVWFQCVHACTQN